MDLSNIDVTHAATSCFTNQAVKSLKDQVQVTFPPLQRYDILNFYIIDIDQIG